MFHESDLNNTYSNLGYTKDATSSNLLSNHTSNHTSNEKSEFMTEGFMQKSLIDEGDGMDPYDSMAEYRASALTQNSMKRNRHNTMCGNG